MRDMRDPYADDMARLVTTTTEGPGMLDATVRQALAAGNLDGMPEALRPYAKKVAREAYRVTDEDVKGLLAAGYSEDQIFEATVCAALGAALARLTAGLAAVEAGTTEAATAEEGE